MYLPTGLGIFLDRRHRVLRGRGVTTRADEYIRVGTIHVRGEGTPRNSFLFDLSTIFVNAVVVVKTRGEVFSASHTQFFVVLSRDHKTYLRIFHANEIPG